jgi:hypothetical protein
MMKTGMFLIALLFVYEQGFTQCNPPTSTADLDISNVRARILNGGDMWWDLIGSALYEVPKGSGKSAFYASGIWLGGQDGGGNLRVAAQTYRQSGNDFWPGPVDTTDGTISIAACSQYDRFWKVNKQEVLDFISGTAGPTPAMSSWPGNGNPALGQARFLAPFEDINGDGIYSPSAGDYPKFDGINGVYSCKGSLHGDQSIWWVINDVGNFHTESNSLFSIGMEIQCQAFAFNTTMEDIANATFYEYKLINRSSLSLYNTYFGFWVDVDLGNYLDDYVGCDVSRGLAYAYNGDNNDEGTYGYGLNPPASGVDIFEGPFADNNDGIDNDRDGTVDELGEQITMSNFLYYDNNLSVYGNPTITQHFYDYMRGIWKNGVNVTYGRNGYNTSGINCSFMYPDDSDSSHWGTGGIDPGFNWSEVNSLPGQSNGKGDRRYLMSAGKFTLMPGEVNYVSLAALWARDSAGGPFYSRTALQRADDLAQSLADNCYDIIFVGIDEIEFEEVLVYPNPAKNTVTIELPYTNGGEYTVSMYSIDGSLLSKKVKYTERVNHFDISDLSSGIYFINLTTEKGKSRSIKFLKQ